MAEKKSDPLLKIIFVLFPFLFSSCAKENSFDCFKSTGKQVQEERYTEKFDGIDISDNINVYLSSSTKHSVVVEAGENIIENIMTEVKSGTLYLKNNNKCNWVRDYDRKINVYISNDQINNISYRGFGEVKTIGKYSNQHFFIDMWMASGKMEMELDCDSVFLKSHTGTADISCKGFAKTLIVYMNGTGIIDAGNLEANYVLAINRDVGDVYIHPQQKLDAEIFSNGDIFYRGPVGQINLVDQGEGELIRF